jgi:hypothetical protein
MKIRSLMVALVLTTGAIHAQTNTSAPAAGGVPADMAAAQQMPDGPDRKKAVSTAAQAWAKSDPIGYYKWLFSLDPKHMGEASGGTGSAAESADPKAAADFLAQNVPANNMPILHGFMLGWTKKDTAAAEAWAVQPTVPEDARYLAIYTVADALVRKDATAKTAVDWTMTVTDPENHLAAIDGTVTIWIRGDPVACTAWIKTLKPDEMKRAAQSAGNSFGNTKGKVGATFEDYVNQLPLSDADKQAVLKGPKVDPYHISKYNAAAAAPAK